MSSPDAAAPKSKDTLRPHLQALGAYIRTLRKAQRMSRAMLAEQAGTSMSQLVRIEAGEQDHRSTLLARILNALGGDLADAAALLLDEQATVEDGRQRAWMRRGQPDPASEADENIPATALGTFVRSLVKLGKGAGLTDTFIRQAEASRISRVEVAIKLLEVGIPKDEIEVLLFADDLPPAVGELLALTHVGIGNAALLMQAYRS